MIALSTSAHAMTGHLVIQIAEKIVHVILRAVAAIRSSGMTSLIMPTTAGAASPRAD
jgi:hypothetical protein